MMASSPVGEHVGLVGVEQAVLAVTPRERFAADPEVVERLELLWVRVLGDEKGLSEDRRSWDNQSNDHDISMNGMHLCSTFNWQVASVRPGGTAGGRTLYPTARTHGIAMKSEAFFQVPKLAVGVRAI